MPISYEVDPTAGLIRVKASGDIHPREVFRHLDQLASDPALGPGLGVLVDVREMTRAPTAEEFKVIAPAYGAAGRGRFEGTRRAFVVSTPLMFGAARQFAVAAEPWGVEIRPFYHETDAIAWLTQLPRTEARE